MAFGPLVINALGPVAAPSDALHVAVQSAIAFPSGTYLRDWGTFQFTPVPTLKGVMIAHGVSAMRNVLEEASYIVGPRAPRSAQTITSTATAATATVTNVSGVDWANGDQIQLGRLGAYDGNGVVTLVTAIDTSLPYDQVKLGGTVALTLQNCYDFVNGTGKQGDKWWSYRQYKQGVPDSGVGTYWDIEQDIEGSSVTATVLTVRAKTPGVEGNAYACVKITTTGGAFTCAAFAGGAVGTGTSPEAGSYRYAYGYVRTVDSALSGISSSGSLKQSTNCNVTLSAHVAPPTRDAMDYYRDYRTDNGGNLFYKDADAAAVPTTDTVPNATIKEALNYLYDPSIFRTYADGYPTVFRAVATLRGQYFGAGCQLDADYSAGTASVTLLTTTVVLSAGTTPKESWIGKTFQATAYTNEYRIVDVDEATRTLTISSPFNGLTSALAPYVIKDKRDPFEVFFTPPRLPNNWPALNYSVQGITSPDPRGVMALIAAWETMVVFTRTGVWQILGSGTSLRLQPISEGMGCFGPNCVQLVDGRLYWIGPDGVFSWSGAGTPESLSRPPVGEGGPAGIQGTIRRINLDEADTTVSVYNQSEKEVIWYVPLDGSTWNRHGLVYDLQTGAFSIDLVPPISAAQSVVGSDGVYRTVLGGVFGGLFESNIGNCDGAFGFEPSLSVLAYGAALRQLAFAGLVLPTTGDALKDVPVLLVDDTTGEYELAQVVSNTTSEAILAWYPSMDAAAVRVAIFGGIALDIESGRFDYQAPHALKSIVSLSAAFTPQNLAARLWVGTAIDDDDPALFVPRGSAVVDFGNLSDGDGEHHYWQRTERGRRLSCRFLALQPGVDVKVEGFSMNVEVEGGRESPD